MCLSIRHERPRVPWILVERSFDASPVTVEFGTLANLALPMSRFWWKDRGGGKGSKGMAKGTNLARQRRRDAQLSQWELLPLAEFQRRGSSKAVLWRFESGGL